MSSQSSTFVLSLTENAWHAATMCFEGSLRHRSDVLAGSEIVLKQNSSINSIYWIIAKSWMFEIGTCQIERKHLILHVVVEANGTHTVEFAGFFGSKFRALRDQICTTEDPKVNHVRQVDF